MSYKKIYTIFLILLLADLLVTYSVEYDSTDGQLIQKNKQNSLNLSQKRSWQSKKKHLIKSLLTDIYQKIYSNEIKEMDTELKAGSEIDAAILLMRRKGKKPFKWG